MKKYIRVLLLMIFSLVIQTAILIYLNNYYLVDDYEVTFTQEQPEAPMEEKVEVKLPSDASNIKLSPTGKYIHFLSGGLLHVVKLDDGRDNKVDLMYEINNYYFRWHDFEDKLIITENNPESGGNAIKIYTYMARDDMKIAALDYNNEIRAYQLFTEDAVVSDIQLNTLNTIMYIKATNKDGTSYISRLDISSGINKLPLGKENIGKFLINKKDDELVFEDLINERVYYTNKSKVDEISIAKDKKFNIIQVDKGDNIYLGEVQDGLIRTVIYNKGKNTEWTSIQLPNLVDINNIFVFNSEQIFIVDRAKNTVTNIITNRQISYAGKFIDMNANGVLSLNGDNALVTKLDNVNQ